MEKEEVGVDLENHPLSDVIKKDGKWVYKRAIASGDYIHIPTEVYSYMMADKMTDN